MSTSTALPLPWPFSFRAAVGASEAQHFKRSPLSPATGQHRSPSPSNPHATHVGCAEHRRFSNLPSALGDAEGLAVGDADGPHGPVISGLLASLIHRFPAIWHFKEAPSFHIHWHLWSGLQEGRFLHT